MTPVFHLMLLLLTTTLLSLAFARLWLRRQWAREVNRLHQARRAASGPFSQVRNNAHQLGRVYGYLYASTRQVRWLSQLRFNHIQALTQEVLFHGDVVGDLQRLVDQRNQDFYRGWAEGQRYFMARHT